MKFYFTTEYTLKIEGTTCVIDEATVKLQEIDLAIPKEFLTIMKTLPKKVEINVRIAPADLFIGDTGTIHKREET